MSKTTKKRYVTKQIVMEMVLPGEDEIISRVIASCGSYLLEVEDANGEKYLASMPAKFRNTVWVKRGNYVILEPIGEGVKVRAEISHILDTENVLYIREKGLWPSRFDGDVELMTRHSKRGTTSDTGIDPNMLPPSESDSEDSYEGNISSEESNV